MIPSGVPSNTTTTSRFILKSPFPCGNSQCNYSCIYAASSAAPASLRRGGRVSPGRSVGRLPEAERGALVVHALAQQPVRLALGFVRAAASRPDPLDRGGDVVDAVGQLHRWFRAPRRPDAERRRGLAGAPCAGVAF